MMIVRGKIIKTMAAVRKLPRNSIRTTKAKAPPKINASKTECWEPATISDWS